MSPCPPRMHPGIRLHSPRRQTAMLLVLLLAMLLMPVSYRAGSDREHAHTIFQGMIDAVLGQPHHHHHHGEDDAHAENDATAEARPDIPNPLGLSTPISSQAAIQILGLLIAGMLTAVAVRPLWADARRLLERAFTEDPPPPRRAWP